MDGFVRKKFAASNQRSTASLAKRAKEDPLKETKDSIIFLDDHPDDEGPQQETEGDYEERLRTAHSLTIDGVPIKFPFRPYPCQIQLMSKMIKCLKGGSSSHGSGAGKEHALLESPTGTGKTLSLLCSVLAWLVAVKQANNLASPTAPRLEPDELIIHPSSPGRPRSGDASAVSASRSTANAGEGIDLDNPASPVDQTRPAPNHQCAESPAAMFAETAPPKIYFATRTHKQIAQIVRELRKTIYRNRFAVLASRSHYCVNSTARNQKDLNDACTDLISDGQCSFYTKRLEKVLRDEWQLALCKSVEELVTFGKRRTLCPYYLSRGVADYADIVFCPFDYIVDPGIREAMGIELSGAVVIFDEAHNIEDVCREAGGCELDHVALFAIREELQGFFDVHDGAALPGVLLPMEHEHQLMTVAVLYNWLVNSQWKGNSAAFERDAEIWEGNEIAETMQRLNLNRDSVSLLLTQLARIEAQRLETKNDPLKEENIGRVMSQGSIRVLIGLYRTIQSMLNKHNIEAFRLVRQREYRFDSHNQKQPLYTLGIWCLNPAIVFRAIASEARSVILTSGTLSPMDTFSSELGTAFAHRLEAPHVIDPGQVWVGAVATGPSGCSLKGTFKELETFGFQDDIARSIVEIANIVPDGVLCFLPSYSFMDRLLKRMDSTGSKMQLKSVKRIFVEPRQGSAAEFEQLMRSYYRAIEAGKGAVFFAVFRGKVSEGLDFADANARAVISVGIPFPALKDDRVIQKRLYNDRLAHDRGLLKGHLWYDKQAYRALNQALGRCIRHRYDWGAVILLERRFHAQNNVEGLSKWIRPEVRKYEHFSEAMESLRHYLAERTLKGE